MLRKVVSFGYRHSGEPQVHDGVVVIDVRKPYANPFHNRALRHLRGTDAVVQSEIRKTPNFQAHFGLLLRRVQAPGVEVAYLGCTGGHHRSVFLAELVGKTLGVPVEHRDIGKP